MYAIRSYYEFLFVCLLRIQTGICRYHKKAEALVGEFRTQNKTETAGDLIGLPVLSDQMSSGFLQPLFKNNIIILRDIRNQGHKLVSPQPGNNITIPA